jgi:hypothetical protein
MMAKITIKISPPRYLQVGVASGHVLETVLLLQLHTDELEREESAVCCSDWATKKTKNCLKQKWP